MLIVSGIIGAFVTLFSISLIAIVIVCIYRARNKSNPSQQNQKIQNTTVITMQQEVDNISVQPNPCFDDISEGTYTIPPCFKILSEEGFSRMEVI